MLTEKTDVSEQLQKFPETGKVQDRQSKWSTSGKEGKELIWMRMD